MAESKQEPQLIGPVSTGNDQKPSHGIEIQLPEGIYHDRPAPVKHVSTPAYQSPLRHHKRAPSRSKAVKETLNARSHYGSSDDDGGSVHRINQYFIKQEIGRGSFGAVHLATDQYGQEFAVKEFSKSRLRKRAQSNLLRKPHQRRRPPHLAAGSGFNSPVHRFTQDTGSQDDNALSLIKEEIAIMKKLSHNNLVALIEVLDDPNEDSLYMVLEMCKKGVVMKVGLDERAEPYSEEACRCWFRDMILGIEYLHAQGIIHRDIKPDNCLITNDDVLKIVDFGVSEMFEKDADMATAKSAGSPAFMPPELCVARHGHVSGKAADIWSMGVTLYCLRYGRIPFEKMHLLELYDSIRNDDVTMEGEEDRSFSDLIYRILEKDPDKRITMEELRVHPWVSKNGTDPLLSTEENCAEILDPPTEVEMAHAITGSIAHLMIVMKAVKRFKKLISTGRESFTDGILSLGRRSQPPQNINYSEERRPRSTTPSVLHSPFQETKLAAGGVHRDIDVGDQLQKLPVDVHQLRVDSALEQDPAVNTSKPEQTRTYSSVQQNRRNFKVDERAKGHAHDPLSDTLYLKIGSGSDMPESDLVGGDIDPVVSESPDAVDNNIYEEAYQEEMNRILQSRGKGASIHLTRRVEHVDDIRTHPNIVNASRQLMRMRHPDVANKWADVKQSGVSSFGDLVAKAREHAAKNHQQDSSEEKGA
ncbi:kinase-like protein [Polychaeton citri CBS 116435]|uniref:Kinase-like protein n=1 Tax=Polychaeton citri CBS 116435 TaxID=1314669 RepID=A0A9P4UP81_9PEZI|nr:kinase-like protein [Polychaeton citri CBS 116435]